MAAFFSGSPKHEAPEPLEGPIVPTIIGGTILWLVLFVVQLPFYGWYADHGHTWWIWTCLAGGGLGFIGIYYVRRRDAAIKRDAAEKAATEAKAADHAKAGTEGAGTEEAGTEEAAVAGTAAEGAATEEPEAGDVTARPAGN
ncbi:DUF2530 domain-containing protein [Streptomyces bottropensis]|uniref:DUF2530 domain-containing protein n=1 Tax=Streptomyces bottropensis TaxID=42235 RepID=A0ABU8ALI7_9ACTN